MKHATDATYYWAEIGDNRVGPIMRELIDALADCDDPHFVRKTARRLRLLSSSLESMASSMAATHDRKECPICQKGSAL